jgi:hypothetical protein
VSEEPNNYEQKKKFHAMVRDISRQVEWAGPRPGSVHA